MAKMIAAGLTTPAIASQASNDQSGSPERRGRTADLGPWSSAGEELACWLRPHRPLLFQRLPVPGEETVPLKEPVVVPVIVSNKRSVMKLPVAPANRPVPPVMVAVSTM